MTMEEICEILSQHRQSIGKRDLLQIETAEAEETHELTEGNNGHVIQLPRIYHHSCAASDRIESCALNVGYYGRRYAAKNQHCKRRNRKTCG